MARRGFGFNEGEESPLGFNITSLAEVTPHARLIEFDRDVDIDLPQAFAPPTSGVATNGLPIYSWDQAAIQLTRSNSTWGVGIGQPAQVTFAFRDTNAGMPSDISGFSRFTPAQITATIEALSLWSEVANISFVRVGQGTTAPEAFTNNATMLFGNYATGFDGASAFAYFPGPSANAGDVWINFSLADNQNPTFGGFGPHTLAHEIGHAIGLSHPANYDATEGSPTYDQNAVYWQDARMFTIMSYFGSANTGGSLNGFAAGPQLHDIAAAQRLYGANMSTRTGDTVYGFNSNTGHQHFSLTADGQSPVFAIWDAGGNDTLDLSGFSTPSEIDLRQEAFSSAGPGNGAVGVAIGNIAIARGAVIENAIGGSGADRIIGNAANNNLNGAGGVDTVAYNVAASSSATWTRTVAGAWTVNAGAGIDTLRDVEYMEFSDRRLALRTPEGNIDGNGTSDILLRSASGAVAAWTQNGATTTTAAIFALSDPTYAAVGTGDFNGDGAYDILFRNANGALVVWQLTGTAVSAVATFASDVFWSIAGIGDFNGDFRDDILFRNSSGVLAQWQMNGVAAPDIAVFAASDPNWSIAAIADFNGDGAEDILYRDNGGLLALWQMNGFDVANAGVIAASDTSWQIVGTGDFNGDLREDILWRSSTGVLAQWQMDGSVATAVGAFAVSDSAWSVSDIGDYNGDGRDDILWQGPDGTFAVWTLDGFATLSVGIVGNPGVGWGDI